MNVIFDEAKEIFYREGTTDKDIIREVKTYDRIDISGAKVIDIGANIGAYSCLVSRKYELNNIAMFEPDPDNFELMRRNSTVIRCRHSCERKIVCEKSSGVIPFYKVPERKKNKGLGSSIKKRGYDTIFVESVGILDVIAENGCDVLKIDIEGGEYPIFEAIFDILSGISVIAAEFHFREKDSIGRFENILSVLKKSGFEAKKYPVYNDKSWATVGVFAK